MRTRTAAAALVVSFSLLSCIYAYQRPFREYPGREYSNFELPADYQEKAEWVFGRLMYPSAPGRGGGFRRGGFGGGRGSDWTQGYTAWTTDYPRSDRHLSAAVRRLTRIHARSVEQPINLDEGDDVYNWPWLYAVEVGQWELTDSQAAKLRDYLLRGGFFMVDDFHGETEWEIFEASIHRVFPDRPIDDLANTDAIFHTIYDLEDRYQVPGAQYLRSGSLSEYGGIVPRWRAIHDDKGRVMVAICHNMDLGDSWEHADNPEYPQKFSLLGMRIGVNYIVYAMTH